MAAYVLPAELNTRYVLGDRLGQGGMGDVFKVTLIATGVIYACKFSSYRSEPHMIKMKRESDIHLAICHPHVVRMLESVNDVSSHRFIMILDLASGGDLTGLMRIHRTQGTFIDEKILWCHLAQILRGLDHLHCPEDRERASGKVPVAHRDLKPENILVEGPTILLADLGCSKFMPDDLHRGTRLGTPLFISPEISRGQQYGLPSDVWSLGCLMFVEATLSAPFRVDLVDTGFPSVTYAKPVFNPAAGVSPRLQTVIMQMLQMNPKARPTASELLEIYEIKTAGQDYDREMRDIKFAVDRMQFEAKMALETEALKRERAELEQKWGVYHQAMLETTQGPTNARTTRSMKRAAVAADLVDKPDLKKIKAGAAEAVAVGAQAAEGSKKVLARDRKKEKVGKAKAVVGDAQAAQGAQGVCVSTFIDGSVLVS